MLELKLIDLTTDSDASRYVKSEMVTVAFASEAAQQRFAAIYRKVG